MEYIFWIVIVIGAGIYLTDRKGWNTTAKRLSTIVRAHIESARPLKQIEKKIEQRELDSWTAEFEGTTGPGHEIVRTWFANFGGELRPFFKCKCGYSTWHVNLDAANRIANEHIFEQNKADELLKKNGGTRAW